MENRPDSLRSAALKEAMTTDGPVRLGDRVLLQPADDGDIFDLALRGKTAVVEAIEQDLDDQLYLAVTVDDDPGRELGRLRKPGHCFFFRPEEVKPLGPCQREAP
jgi:hypothetical protein